MKTDQNIEKALLPWTNNNYSHSYKENPKWLCFETGYFGLKINSNDLSKILFRTFELKSKEISYFEAISQSNRERMDDSNLYEEDLAIEIVLGDGDDGGGAIKTYRASRHTIFPRLWESGKLVQHYDFKGVEFRKQSSYCGSELQECQIDEGELLKGCEATLYVLVWPDSVTFSLELSPLDNGDDTSWWSNGFSVQFKMRHWNEKLTFNPGPVTKETTNVMASFHCNLDQDRKTFWDKVMVKVSTTPQQEMQSIFSESFNCFQLGRPNSKFLKRSFKQGYTDIHDYDVFEIRVKNANIGIDTYVPILLFVQCLANPTGCCPILCDENNVPTGIPVQLSKNWHEPSMCNYGRFYCLLPTKGNGEWTTYHMRIVYGYYGKLPSASHSNLSLVGWKNNSGGRWDQLAIGCWGETYCMDIDMTLVQNTITDIRMLMTKGEDEKKWNWSDAGWGGDWLNIKDERGKRLLFPFGWKTAYMSHGPCLSEVYYDGWYSTDRSVGISANVKTLRTDDYARTFTTLSFTFNQTEPASKASFFRLGGSADMKTPKIVLGNRDGLIAEYDVPTNMKMGTFFLENKELSGKRPWFIGFPEQYLENDKSWGKGWRALIIREYNATFDAETYHNPSISLQVTRKNYVNGTNLSLFIVKNAKNTNQRMDRKSEKQKLSSLFARGDQVTLEVELITLPRKVEDYYGPNKAFQRHLEKKPKAWETIYREVVSNDLNVMIRHGGYLKKSYPVIIHSAGDNRIDFTIEGGLGAVPIRFDGLISKDYSLFRCNAGMEIELRLQQENFGNDFWQTEFDPLTGTYSQAYNVLLDEDSISQWTLHSR